MSHSIGKSARAKPPKQDRPAKPYPDFPMYPHPSGNWAKKIRGKLHYFGRWGRIIDGKMTRLEGDGWVNAKALFDAQFKALEEGRKPRELPQDGEDVLTVKLLCNKFLNSKLKRVEQEKLSQRQFAEYRDTAKRLCKALGNDRPVDDLRPSDFEDLADSIAKHYGVSRQINEITRTKSFFKYALENELIEKPMNFGSEFKKPSIKEQREHRAKQSKKLFTPAEIRKLIEEATPTFKAAILLGANAGFGNSDIAHLAFSNLDLKSGWITYPRGKTGIQRRVPLWPETIAAIKTAIESRKKPKLKADADVVLLTIRGERLVRITKESRTDGIAVGFGKLLRKLKINGRKGLGFYSLRHTFATIGLQARDRDAVKAIMGHAESDMLSIYDETGPSDERLITVVNHVRNWLFGQTGGAK